MKFCEPTSKNCNASRKSPTLRAVPMRWNASSSRVGENPVYCTDNAVPAAMSIDSSGPLLRRGTTNVFAGIAPPGGTTSTALDRPAVRLLARNVSSIACTCSRRPWYTVDRPLGEPASRSIRSTNVSVTSIGFIVAPHAIVRFSPRIT